MIQRLKESKLEHFPIFSLQLNYLCENTDKTLNKNYWRHFICKFWWKLFFFLTLQYCIGFAIYQNESTTGIHVFPILNPPPSPYHPSGLSQCTSPKHPVSCIKPGLETRFMYDIIHVSMPFSQIIPPSPSPRVQKTVLYISVSFAVLYTGLLLPSF